MNKFSSSKLLKKFCFQMWKFIVSIIFFSISNTSGSFNTMPIMTKYNFLWSFFPSVDCIALFVSFCPDQVNSNCQLSRGGSKEGGRWLTEVKSCLSLIFWVLFFQKSHIWVWKRISPSPNSCHKTVTHLPKIQDPTWSPVKITIA